MVHPLWCGQQKSNPIIANSFDLNMNMTLDTVTDYFMVVVRV